MDTSESVGTGVADTEFLDVLTAWSQLTLPCSNTCKSMRADCEGGRDMHEICMKKLVLRARHLPNLSSMQVKKASLGHRKHICLRSTVWPHPRSKVRDASNPGHQRLGITVFKAKASNDSDKSLQDDTIDLGTPVPAYTPAQLQTVLHCYN